MTKNQKKLLILKRELKEIQALKKQLLNKGIIMAMRKKKVRKGNYFSRVQRSPKVRKVKAKIRKQKSVLKRLSAEYRRALKKVK